MRMTIYFRDVHLSCVYSRIAKHPQSDFRRGHRSNPNRAHASLRTVGSRAITLVIACGVMPGIIAIVGYLKTDALTAIVSFAAIGIYIVFRMIVLGVLIARRRG